MLQFFALVTFVAVSFGMPGLAQAQAGAAVAAAAGGMDGLAPVLLPPRPGDIVAPRPPELARRTWSAEATVGATLTPCALRPGGTCVAGSGNEVGLHLNWRPAPAVAWGAMLSRNHSVVNDGAGWEGRVVDDTLSFALAVRAFFRSDGSFDPFVFATLGYGSLERRATRDDRAGTQRWPAGAPLASAGGGFGWMPTDRTRLDVTLSLRRWLPLSSTEACSEVGALECAIPALDRLWGLEQAQFVLNVGIVGLFGERL